MRQEKETPGGSPAATARDAQPPIELLVRGDDMGHSLDVNQAFVKAHTEGILTSASLIAPDGFFHRGLAGFLGGQPRIAEVANEVRAQIEKCRRTGLRFVYLDWHMSSNGGNQRPEIEELFRQLSREYGLLYSHDAQDVDGRYSGAKYFAAGIEAWGTQTLPDGTLAYWCGPDLPDATRLKFLDSLRNLQPGTWYTVCHPGLYARRQAQSVAVICSREVRDILRTRGIRLISYADLRERKLRQP